MPLRTYRTLQGIDKEGLLSVMGVGKLQVSFEAIHEELSSRNEQMHTKAQQLHNARTNVLPVNIVVGDFLMVRVNAKQGHKPQMKWKGPMRVVEAKSHFLFVLEGIARSKKLTARAQRVIS